MEKYAAYLYISTGFIKLAFSAFRNGCEMHFTEYGIKGYMKEYKTIFYGTDIREFRHRKVYCNDNGKVIEAIIKPVLKCSAYYNSFSDFR